MIDRRAYLVLLRGGILRLLLGENGGLVVHGSSGLLLRDVGRFLRRNWRRGKSEWERRRYRLGSGRGIHGCFKRRRIN